MATSKLGVYFCPSHDRPGDWDYIRNLNPPVVRILMPGDAPTTLVSRVHQTAPNARISLRWWDVDDGGEGNKRGKLNSPEASAVKDAKTFCDRIQQMEFDAEESGLPFPPRNRLLVNALNEPPSWEHDKRPAIVDYNCTLIAEMEQFGVPVAALCLAVGHPEEWPPVWDWAQPVIDIIRILPHSVLELHCYWQLEGPNHIWTDEQGNQRKDWGALAGRYLHCPFDVEILVGECGADGRLYDRRPQHTGWRGNIPASVYAAQLRFYLEHIHQDSRIIAALPFLTDTPDMQSWGSFDTEQAHNDILTMVRSLPPVPTPTPQPTLPDTLWVRVLAANLRAGPGTEFDILRELPQGTALTVTGTSQARDWYQVRTGNDSGWVFASLLSTSPVSVAPVPAPVPTGDKWARSIAFVLKEEGGLSTDKNDPGNYVNGVFVGTNFGISANAHPGVDIVNLTVEQAKNIYRDSYWIPSGASQMPFPLCLAVMDLAVNGGVGRAKEALNATGHDFVRYMAWRIDWYTRIQNFERYGVAWIRRCSRLMMEATK